MNSRGQWQEQQKQQHQGVEVPLPSHLLPLQQQHSRQAPMCMWDMQAWQRLQPPQPCSANTGY